MTDEEIDALFRRESDASVRARLRSVQPPAPPPPPSPSGLVRAADLTHLYAFRLPREPSNGQGFEGGGHHLALAADGVTLFLLNHHGSVAEVTIPHDSMAFAAYVQGFAEITEGRLAAAFGDLATPAGLLVLGDQLLGTVSVYYDANNTQRAGHFTRPSNLADRGHVSDFWPVWQADKTGFVAGYLAHVPPAWQARLQGEILTGQWGIPIVSRTSWGPAAIVISAPTPMAFVMPLLYYTGDHPTLGRWDATAANPTYNSTAAAGGLVCVDDAALFFGRTGLGRQTYGIGTNDPAKFTDGDITLDGLPDGEGGRFCYDPANSSKGPHAYPYRYQVWAYDLHEFAVVAAGTKQPWEVVPYDVWELPLPTPEHEFRGLGGAAYDPATRRLYVSQLSADQDGYAYRALIHVFQVKV